MSDRSSGLRESKKRQTREAISEHARRLFVAQGFEATTIAEVAAAARVAKKTVTNYFARKEDLVLDFHEEFIGSLADTVRSRPAGASVLQALRIRYQADLRAHSSLVGFSSLEFARVIAESPTLTARLRDLHEQREHALAAEMIGEGGGQDAVATRAVAAHLATAHRVLFQRVQELILSGDGPEAVAGGVAKEAQRLFDILEPSFGDV